MDTTELCGTALLKPQDRVRHKRYPELTGRVKQYEWSDNPAHKGQLSPLPYCIDWDDSRWASELLGWFFVYASDASVERLEEVAT